MQQISRVRIDSEPADPIFRSQTILYRMDTKDDVFGVQLRSDHTIECVAIPVDAQASVSVTTLVRLPSILDGYFIRRVFCIAGKNGFFALGEAKDVTSPSVVFQCVVNVESYSLEVEVFSFSDQIFLQHNCWDAEHQVLWVIYWDTQQFQPVLIQYDLQSIESVADSVLDAKDRIALPSWLFLPQISTLTVSISGRVLVTYLHEMAYVHEFSVESVDTEQTEHDLSPFRIPLPEVCRHELICSTVYIQSDIIFICLTRHCVLYHAKDGVWTLIDAKSFPLAHSMSRIVACQQIRQNSEYPMQFLVSSSMGNVWIVTLTVFDVDELPMIEVGVDDMQVDKADTDSWHASGVFDLVLDDSVSTTTSPTYLYLESNAFSELRLNSFTL